jgi:hypothetical protein
MPEISSCKPSSSRIRGALAPRILCISSISVPFLEDNDDYFWKFGYFGARTFVFLLVLGLVPPLHNTRILRSKGFASCDAFSQLCCIGMCEETHCGVTSVSLSTASQVTLEGKHATSGCGRRCQKKDWRSQSGIENGKVAPDN